ncbi:ubiquinone biosynthesis protein [Cavenderia fasciculata]|uniref:Ubiquinone biosynthesis protein n=1 Tax=Cavenderia fasciculata TaxID=261658 RepID=F4PHH4_CACFS|nr:ubiquinone biosynthesis protein [Cavenderia fasciculata]EGG25158.1 ubiquinone biosynthesis protein [Cavenderia fasciculata]|eukprot:XP_004363009.1 ubiquinone biosynthesis protein [Cavenderia fasciculata]
MINIRRLLNNRNTTKLCSIQSTFKSSNYSRSFTTIYKYQSSSSLSSYETSLSSSLINNNNNNKNRYYSTEINNNNDNKDNQKQQQQEEQEESEEVHGIDNVKEIILEKALKNVSLYGWSDTSISMACTELGYSNITHGLFENGGYDLAYYFVTRCNNQLKEKLSSDILMGLTPRERIKMVIKIRLSMLIPYIHRWSEAMQLLAHPKNLINSAPSMANLVDEVWHLVDDRSSDFEWYSKRALLAALYTSSELFMITDTSPEYKNTWRFVDDRVDDLISIIKFKRDVGESLSMTTGVVMNMINNTFNKK